jgi:hypothetical protein
VFLEGLTRRRKAREGLRIYLGSVGNPSDQIANLGGNFQNFSVPWSLRLSGLA